MLLQIFSPVKAHFIICFLALVIYRYLERNLENAFSCETILDKLRTMNFADIQEQGFIPLYTRDKLTDALHTVCGFETCLSSVCTAFFIVAFLTLIHSCICSF